MRRFTFLLCIISVSVPGCKKFVDIDPPIDKITNEYAYGDNTNAAAVLSGIYYQMADGFIFDVSLIPGLSADEFEFLNNGNLSQQTAYTNSLTSNDAPLWTGLYSFVFKSNAAIEGLTESSSLSSAIKKQLIGEAKFVRAFCYFYLVNLFGDVPLLTTSNYQTNALLGRTSVSIVYQQIIKDLKDAQSELSENYLASDAITVSSDRVRPNKGAATALLARAYLYTGEWANAELESSVVIENSNYFLATDLSSVFGTASPEAIWQLQPVDPLNNTREAREFISTTTNLKPYLLSKNLYEAFENDDQRKANWTDSVEIAGTAYHFPFKYKTGAKGASDPLVEYEMVLRLAEQFLIRAEARAKQGKLTGNNSAESDVNTIRSRAGLIAISETTEQDILVAIENECRVELFNECGLRWLNLKRNNHTEIVMPSITAIKGGVWESADKLYPIPLEDMKKAPNLRPQNPGYTGL